MKQVKDVIEMPLMSPYRGSEKTFEMVKQQVAERWGHKVADSFNAQTDAMPFSWWLKYGYAVKKNEKALHSVTFIESEDPKTGEVKTVRKTCFLFHRKQVEKVKPKQAV